MKNIINTLLRKLYMRIPEEILVEAFQPRQNARSLDSLIKSEIIVDIVLSQCNLYAGKTKKITLLPDFLKPITDSAVYSAVPGDYSIYAVPPQFREFRPISVVLDIAYPSSLALNSAYPYSFLSGRTVANGIDEALTSFTHTPAYITPTPVLLDGDNGIVQLHPPMSMHTDWILSCMLAYDKDFTNISTNMINPLFDCTLYATQAYIYNKLYIRLNQGYLQGGLQLEAIRAVVESYAESPEKFEESLRKFRGAALFDKDSMIDLLSLMVGG